MAAEVWERFGKVENFVEPFFGTGAVLLAAPEPAPVETANDADSYVANFWRAVSTDPEEVAYWADAPVHECDLHAKHAYLVKRIPWLTERLMGDPSFFDPKLAGWWVWGLCSWIGGGWCCGKGPWTERGGVLLHRDMIPDGADGEPGLPTLQLVHLGNKGQGINRASVRRRIPNLTAGFNGAGAGINGASVHLNLPHLGDRGKGACRPTANIAEWFQSLQDRLRRVRFACGDWRRVLTPSVTFRHGLTAVFLDPPYKGGNYEYSGGGPDPNLHVDLEAWCQENGSNPLLRIALCGHEGDYNLEGWEIYRWKARGGYGNIGGNDADDNRHREAIWFSPGCLRGRQGRLF